MACYFFTFDFSDLFITSINCVAEFTNSAQLVVVSGPPTLPQLLRLKIPQRVGANYSTFGIFLLNDTVGSRVKSLEMGCLGKPDKIVQQILQEWLEGRGLEPVTWETLIKTLRDSDLSALADEVHQKQLLSPPPHHP